MYKIAHNVLLVLRQRILFAFDKEYFITYNFDPTQKFDFILTKKFYLNWLQSTRNQCLYTFINIIKPWNIFDFIDFCGP